MNCNLSFEERAKLAMELFSYLRESTITSKETKGNKPNKLEETEKLIEYINAKQLWNCNINFDLFLS